MLKQFLIVSFAALAHAERPNLIFILTDDQRQDSLPLYGNTFVKTPHLDALAAESITFDNASVTSAICTPSRASYFSGQYERRHGINFNSGTAMSPAAWEKCYPIQLRESGYFTGYIGKNHLPVGAHGYQTGLIEKSFDYWFAGHGHIFFYPKDRHKIFQSAQADTQIEIIAEGSENFLSGDAFIEGAHSFLSSRDRSRPFALSLALNLPHSAGTRTMEMRPSDDALYRTTYRDQLASLPLPKTYLAKADIKSPKLPPDLLHTSFRQEGYNFVDSPDTNRERMLRQYQTITGIDRIVGRLRAKLAELKVADNTVIIFTSDHGLLLGDHGLGGKALNYEPCLAVPLIIHDPRITNARREKALVQSIDIAPTLLDYAGATIPPSMQGSSLKPLIEGKVEKVRRFAFAENLWSTVFGNPRIESIRGPRFKYIRYFKNSRERWQSPTKNSSYQVSPAEAAAYRTSLDASIKGEEPVYQELFDLKNDPLELANLVADPAHQKTLKKMRQQCRAHVSLARGDYRKPPASIRLKE